MYVWVPLKLTQNGRTRKDFSIFYSILYFKRVYKSSQKSRWFCSLQENNPAKNSQMYTEVGFSRSLKRIRNSLCFVSVNLFRLKREAGGIKKVFRFFSPLQALRSPQQYFFLSSRMRSNLWIFLLIKQSYIYIYKISYIYTCMYIFICMEDQGLLQLKRQPSLCSQQLLSKLLDVIRQCYPQKNKIADKAIFQIYKLLLFPDRA